MSVEKILPIARALANRAEGMSNSEFAKGANLTSSASGAYLSAYVKAKHIFRGCREGDRGGRYFGTEREADLYAQGGKTSTQVAPDMIARACVAQMRQNQIRSTVNLAEICHVTAAEVDLALAPLVEAQKLLRVDVLRGGVKMFDYRFSASWTPKVEDFEACDGKGEAPRVAVSPVTPPPAKPVPPPPARAPSQPTSAPKPAPVSAAAAAKPETAPPPASSPEGEAVVAPTLSTWLQQAHMCDASIDTAAPAEKAKTQQAKDALAAGAELGKIAAGHQVARPLGFELVAEGATLDSASLDVLLEQAAVPNILEADDLVCAINSRGELAIDLGEGSLIKFPPVQALALKRFLDNTSIIEELAGRGQI